MSGDDRSLRPQRNYRAVIPRHRRRLPDKILMAFHRACDLGDFAVAARLLNVLETMLVDRDPTNANGNRRRNLDSLVAAHERLWGLRHPDGRPGWDFLAPNLPDGPEATR